MTPVTWGLCALLAVLFVLLCVVIFEGKGGRRK